MVYLCSRMGTSGYGILGRETAMDPIIWTADGWPLVNSLKGPSDLQRKPKIVRDNAVGVADWCKDKVGKKADATFAPELGIWGEWNTVRGAYPGSFEAVDEQILIHGNGLDLNTMDYSTVLLQPQQAFSFEMSCRVKGGFVAEQENMPLNGTGSGDWDVGLTCYYDENSYLKFALANRQGKWGILAAEYVDDRYVTNKWIPLDVETERPMNEDMVNAKQIKANAVEENSISANSVKANQENVAVANAIYNESHENGLDNQGAIAVELRIVTEDLKRCCYYRIQERLLADGEVSDTEIAQNEVSEPVGAWHHAATFENTSYLSSEGLSKGKRFTGAMAGIYVNGKVTAVFEEFEMSN